MFLKHIRMISEGSCDTEDLSTDAEHSALRHRNKLHFKIILANKTAISKCNNISQYFGYYRIFDQMNSN